jgi:hypothetical protein
MGLLQMDTGCGTPYVLAEGVRLGSPYIRPCMSKLGYTLSSIQAGIVDPYVFNLSSVEHTSAYSHIGNRSVRIMFRNTRPNILSP